jgi:hypothetical protein
MINISLYSQDKKRSWNNFVENSKNSTFLLNRDYMDYHSDRFSDYSLMFYDDTNLIAMLPANKDGNTVISHQGLTYGGLILGTKIRIVSVLEIFKSLILFLKQNNIHKFIYKPTPHIYHSIPSEEDLYALFVNKARCSRRDISTVITQNYVVGFDRSRKRGVKKSISSGIMVKESQDFQGMYDIIKSVLNSKFNKDPVHSAAEMKLLSERFPENIKSYACYDGNKMISCAYIYATQNVAHAQYVYSSDEGKEKGANDLMYDFLINTEFSNKRYFDFGISTENNGLYLNEGLIGQKEMFGGRALCYDQYELKII